MSARDAVEARMRAKLPPLPEPEPETAPIDVLNSAAGDSGREFDAAWDDSPADEPE